MNQTLTASRAPLRSADGRRTPGRQLRQRGISLLFALAALVGLSIAGAAMMRTADTTSLVAGNTGFHGAAVQSTDLGLEAALAALATLSTSGATDSNDTAQNYYASLDGAAPDPTAPPASRLSTSTANAITDSATGNTLRYVIERLCSATGAPSASCVRDASGNLLYRITVLALGPRNTSATVQGYVTAAGPSLNCAVLVQDSLALTNGLQASGTHDCVLTNGDITGGGGGPYDAGDVMAAGTIDSSAATKFTAAGGNPMPNQTPTSLPAINPSAYQAHADYIFGSDGHVYSQSGGVLTDLGTSWQGWSYSGGEWKISNSTPSAPGLYYFEGNVESTSATGTPASPWNVSWIATGSIKMSNSPFFQDYVSPSPSVPATVNYIFMMAGGDVSFSGSTSSAMQVGLLAAGNSIKFTNDPQLLGQVVATNAGLPSGAANLNNGENKITNNLRITYNGNGWQVPVGTTARLAWRSVYR